MALVEHMASKRAVRRDRGAASILRSLAGGVVPLLLAALIVLPSTEGALCLPMSHVGREGWVGMLRRLCCGRDPIRFLSMPGHHRYCVFADSLE